MNSLSSSQMVRHPGSSQLFTQRLQSEPFSAVSEYYAECLGESTKAVAFLKEEFGLTFEQAGELQVGFVDRTLGKMIPKRGTELGRMIRERLTDAGLFKGTGHESLRGCVTFPLRDERGEITGIDGRRVDKHGKGPQEITIGTGERKELIGQQEYQLADRVSKLTDGVKARSKPKRDTKDLMIEESQILFVRDDRRYRVRGLEQNKKAITLKINLMVSRDDLVHLDTLDLTKSRSRVSFIKTAGEELFVDADLIKRDIGQLLLKLETLREQQITETKAVKVQVVEPSPREKDEAMKLLRDPQLLQRIVADMDVCGMVGESNNKLVGYLAATSRKLRNPLAIVIQSSTSAGKTSLMDAILDMMPSEQTLRFSGITGQSLYYLESDSIRHNILAISEEEGMSEAAYALKLLQSEGELRHATVGRDDAGSMMTRQHHVQGPVQIMLTTTAMDIDEELVNRCLLLSVDESRTQTGAIQDKQRRARNVEELRAQVSSERLRKLHQNAQRLIQAYRVFNPYASQLTFPNNKTRLRRDHEKYLTLIDTIALLHQHQRQVKLTEIDGETIEYIDVEPSDIAVANGIAGEVLGRSLDELSPPTRRLLQLLHEYVATQSKASDVSKHAFRFTRRDVREATGWSDSQLHKHLTRLSDLEYLVVHRGKAGRRFVYELLYRGEGHEGQPFLMGLIDPAKLKTRSTAGTLCP